MKAVSLIICRVLKNAVVYYWSFVDMNIGDFVVCIREKNCPNFVGKIWRIIKISGDLYYCENINYYKWEDGFLFKEGEIVPASSLLRELA